MRILLVEDDSIIALALAEELESCGMQVVGPVATAAAALKALDSEPVDFVVLDYRLKGGTADPVADALAQGDIPFVWLTAYDAGSIRPRGAPVLEKPIRADLLLARIQMHMPPVG